MELKAQAKQHVMGLVSKITGGIVGLVVAGGLMWFTPLIDRFVKPAKPLANFASEEGSDHLTVTFKNLSANAKQARWDFGDGSPLELMPGDQTEIKHKFKKPNTYKVKLVVVNVANQEDVRESNIAVGLKPQILDLSMKPLNQKTKPFTAGVKVKFEATADLDAALEWDFGNGIYQEDKDSVVHEFPLPGKHLVKVRAVMGHQKGAPMLQEIEVLPQSGVVVTGGTQSPGVAVSTRRPNPATLSVEVAVRAQLTGDVLKRERPFIVNLKGKSAGNTIQETFRATPGYVIKSVRFEQASLKKTANVINESVTTADDGKSLIVKAQLTRPGTDYSFNVAVLFVEEMDSATTRESTAVMTLPGTGSLELPPGSRHDLEIKYLNTTVVKLSELPIKAFEFTVEGRSFSVSSAKANGRVNLSMRELPRPFRVQ